MTTAGDNEDPISAASAGLRALGVAPQRRMETLGLLGALLDLADEHGDVQLDGDLMQTEERLGIDACLEGYEWLERLDVIRRTFSGWVIQNVAAHSGPAGMNEASLAVLQKHLAATHDEPVATAVPVVAREAAPLVTLKTWRRRVPVIAASVAAGVAVLTGATQFMPQAAVTTRNAAEHTAKATVGGLPETSAPAVAAGAATTALSTVVGESPGATAVTTTTSTTLLPAVPCLGDVLRGLGTRTSLRTTPTTQNAPGVLPCP